MIGSLKTEGDLRRFILDTLTEPGAIQPHQIVGLDAVEPIQAPALATGWSDFGSGHQGAGFYTDRGRVYLCGSVANGGTGTGLLFTLPPGYWPGASEVFKVSTSGGNSADVLVAGDGTVTDATFDASSKARLSLAGISFRRA